MLLCQQDFKVLEAKVFENFSQCYDKEQSSLYNLALHCKTEGEIRAAAGNLVEALLQNIFDTINGNLDLKDRRIISKVGSTDYLSKSVLYKGVTITNNNIQVDRHIWSGRRRIAFIENKTYLDSCYFDRALADFRKIAQSLHQAHIDPSTMEYIVFAGQNAANKQTLLTYEADFWSDTKLICSKGIEPKVVFFLRGKRSSSKPLYRVKHEIDFDAIRYFLKLIMHII